MGVVPSTGHFTCYYELAGGAEADTNSYRKKPPSYKAVVVA